jgi:hypothetical protein
MIFSIANMDFSIVSQPRDQWTLVSLIAPACISASLGIGFFYWVHRQEAIGKPCMIPLSLFRNQTFSSICAVVFLTFAGFNSASVLLTFVYVIVYHQSINTLDSRG